MMPTSIDGFLLLDKPTGCTSNAALQKVKRLLAATKAGHTGSLDPLATGMLPICIGQATKYAQYILNADKAYRVGMRLGITTTTLDRQGEVVDTHPVPTINSQTLGNTLASFVGEQDQVPPMYSALKHQGKRLYELARAGKTVERPARQVTIFSIDEVVIKGKDLIEFTVRASKGTYIRSLVADIGQQLGCGAHVDSLHRQYVSPFEQANMISLDALMNQTLSERQAALLPLAAIMGQLMPSVQVNLSEQQRLQNGLRIEKADAPLGQLALFSDRGAFLGIGTKGADGQIMPSRLMAFSNIISSENVVE